MSGPLFSHAWQHRASNVVCTIEIDAEHHVPELRVKALHGPIGRVRASGVDEDVDPSELRASLRGELVHLLGVRGVGGQNLDGVSFACKLFLQAAQAILTAGRSHHPRAFAGEQNRAGSADSAGRTYDEYDLI